MYSWMVKERPRTTADNVLCSACKVYLPYGGISLMQACGRTLVY